MNYETVVHHASSGGIGIQGVEIRLVADEGLAGRGLWGFTHPDGKIDLYPDAFLSDEHLVRTLGHERTHVMQLQLHGPPGDSRILRSCEDAAYEIEDSFVHYFKTKGRPQ
jgi:hypothetical protein